MFDSIDVIAPLEQEGTQAVIKTWLKKVGEEVAEGDPLVELETDKVAVEVPAPASGVVSEIIIEADTAVTPGTVIARLRPGKAQETPAAETARAPATQEAPPKPNGADPGGGVEHRLSPSVRRLVTENDIDPSVISGTGRNGRLTRKDVLDHLEARKTIPDSVPLARPAPPLPSADGLAGERIPHDSMRRRIAEHMSHSVATAPHVTAVFEADFSAVMAHRNRHKAAYLAQGAKLTYTAYLVSACVEAMKVSPRVNSRWHDDYLEVFTDVNIGVGTALGDKGLIVPVIRKAQTLSLFGIAKALDEFTAKAREGKLSPADVRGGTFSISNHGTSGSLVATPIIINQPQSAILGVGKLEKRVVVREVDGADSLQIRPMAYVSLTIDHRVLDGAQTNAWLTRFVEVLETWPKD